MDIWSIGFAIVCYGSMLLSPFCLFLLLLCGIGIITGKWDRKGFADRWAKGRKMIIGFSIPPVVFLISIGWLEYSRSFRNGYRIEYMNSSACYLVHENSTVVIDEHILERSIVTNGNLVSGKLANGKNFVLNTETGKVTYTPP